MMKRLSFVGTQKIAHQFEELAKLGLSQKQIDEIILKNAQRRKALNQR